MPWTVLHDPLELTKWRLDVANLEEDAREQGEDIILMVCEHAHAKKHQASLGWFQSIYIVHLVEDEEWESPITRIECRDLPSALAALQRLAAF